ncbi:MAG: TIR domain-containing protein, partial [Sphingomicrobium sp.]
MPQVFVSYARTDKRQVIKLVSALRKVGIEPWWDDDIPPGADWEQTIEKALVDAQAVVVCWSPVSVGSENVRSEGRVARGRGRLVQVFLQPCDPPLFFGERQGIDLTDWNGSVRAPQFGRLKQALQSIIDANPAGEIRSLSQARSRWRFPKPAVGIAAGAIAIVALGSLWWTSSSPAKAASKVAVLPIKGLGGAPALLSVADGLTDQINTSLSDGRIPTVSGSDSGSLNGNETDQKLKSLAVGYTV